MRKPRRFILPAYLFLCLLVGGSSQGNWSNAVLQLIAVLMLGYLAIARRGEPLGRAGRVLFVIAVAALAVILLQLVPLPPSVWQSFGGRDLVASGQASLGYQPSWQPISLAPYATIQTALTLLPPLAVAAWVLRVRNLDEPLVAGGVVLGALANVLLGAVQVASAGHAEWAYFDRFSSTGAVGFFANRNHMASLLVAAIPFAAMLFAGGQAKLRGRGSGFAVAATGGGALLLLIIGILLNASLAAFALVVPVLALSALLLQAGWRLRRLFAPVGAVALIGAVVALGNGSVRSDLAGISDLGSVYSRQHMWAATAGSIAETFPVGTGLGTFARIYALHDDPAVVDPNYVNHAHNDYLELILELGLPGLLLIIAGLIWWAGAAIAVWRSPISTTLAKAATIASAALLAHSLVDFPLRSPGLAALLAACFALMVPRSGGREAGKARHVTIA
jgi:O-antigen ligase